MQIKPLLYFLLTLFFYNISSAQAITRIDITKGVMEPMPIAVTDFVGDMSADTAMGRNIASVIAADLERSGLFRPIESSAFIERIATRTTVPNFASWRQINSNALVTGYVHLDRSELVVEFRLWDVFMGQQIAGQLYNAPADDWRSAAHMISDQIYKRLTGEEGYFNTRIVYVSETGPAIKRIKKLAIMDQDGENHYFLTDGSHLVLTPRFSPSLQQILYLSYANKKPRVYIRDIATGRERILGDFPGMSFAPRFSPNGKTAIMSVAENGNTDIYTLNLQTMEKDRLTDDAAIDTSPSYSPDTKRIVFNSDRGGTEQLYVMNADGSNASRISFGEGRYYAPAWSPRGDYIAFTKKIRSTFYIGVIRPNGSGERILTQGYLVEGASWAPNGRVLIFTRQEPSQNGKPGVSKLFTIDLTGHNERELITPTDASDPAWSPLIQ